MDYGKLAYLKVEDLTRRMESVEETSVYPYGVSLATGTSAKHRITAKRATVASLIIRVRVTPTSSRTVLALYVGGVCAYEASYVLQGAEQDVFFMAHANLDKGSNEVALTVDGAEAGTVDVMVFGEGMSMSESVRMSVARKYLALCRDGEVVVFDAEHLVEKFRLPCRDASVFCGVGGDKLVWTDASGTWLLNLTESGMWRVEYVDAPCDSVTGCDDNGFDALACVRKGIATCGHAPMLVARDCANVIAVYGASVPTFVVSRSGGAFYLCRALPKVQAGRAS